MTNEEATAILKLYRKRLKESCSNLLENDIRAFDVAIEALENDKPKGKWIPEKKMNDKHNIGWLDKKVNIMEEDAKQASIPYSMPKDYIKNRLDYER